MPQYFIDQNGNYYETITEIEAPPGHTEVAQRVPSPPSPEAARAGMVCSRFQARAALMQAGLLDQAEAIIAQADALTQLAWAEAVEFRRNSPTINAMGAALGMTDAQLDALFEAAMGIEA